jgi:hypothetical protein
MSTPVVIFLASVGCFAARRPLLGVFCLIVAALAGGDCPPICLSEAM